MQTGAGRNARRDLPSDQVTLVKSQPTSGPFTRRRFLIGAGGVAAAGVAAGVVLSGGQSRARSGVGRDGATGAAAPVPRVELPSAPIGLPERQYAWEATERRDQFGNAVAPRYDRLLFFDVRGTPGPNSARLLEASLRDLEHSYPWGPGGLLFVTGWGHDYFTDVLRTDSPIPPARALSEFEAPTIDRYHLCLHLASDHQQRLLTVERSLRRKLAPALIWRQTRTGFVGAGLPAANQKVGGIPAGRPVPKSAPLYMGFKSNLKKNQASEDAITIPDGRFAQGTTMQVSYMTLSLQSWYQNLTYAERVARMYSPQTTVEDVKRFTTDAESNPNEFNQAVTRYGVVGHSQTSARARRHGKPVILRRDFDTADGGQAGLHFVCLQRDIADFVSTRTAMNAANAQLKNPAITDTVNNGINEFIFVLNRGNYIVPSRAERSFPLLAGRDSSL